MNKNKKINIIINIIAVSIIVIILTILFIKYGYLLEKLKTESGREEFIRLIQSTGIFGSLIIILIQTLQVVVAFIPGEFVEIISGAMFGPVLGLILCLIGLNIGTLLIYLLVKLLGKPFVKENINSEYKILKFLNDPTRALIIIFFIFLLPGIPKDILIFPMPLTKIKMQKFMIVSSIARIPSILSSTIIGSSLVNEKYMLSIITFIIFMLLGILGLIFNNKIYQAIIKASNTLKKHKNENDI